MSEMTIFSDPTAGGMQTTGAKPLSKLGQTLASSGGSTRRIQAHNSGTFRRIIAGQMVGKPLRGELNIIILNALPNVSRTYYKADYDPEAPPTLPDCWSNDGERPEQTASNKQSDRCADCPMNIAGSGSHGGRACRYQRRVAVMVPGDTQENIYQFNIPAKSLFGKGSGNLHPFESYVRFLAAHGESPDTVITSVKFNDEAETMELQFSPVRPVSAEELEVVQRLQESPDCEAYVRLVAAQMDGVTTTPQEAAAPKAEAQKTPEKTPEPTKRPAKKKNSAKEAPKVELDPDEAGESGMDDLISAWANAE